MIWAWTCLLMAVVCSTGGNALAKLAGHGPAAGRRAPAFVAGAGLFGAGLVFYAQALTVLPLALAYPVLVGATLAGVSLVAAARFRERIAGPHAAGIALILAGLAVLGGGLGVG